MSLYEYGNLIPLSDTTRKFLTSPITALKNLHAEKADDVWLPQTLFNITCPDPDEYQKMFPISKDSTFYRLLVDYKEKPRYTEMETYKWHLLHEALDEVSLIEISTYGVGTWETLFHGELTPLVISHIIAEGGPSAAALIEIEVTVKELTAVVSRFPSIFSIVPSPNKDASSRFGSMMRCGIRTSFTPYIYNVYEECRKVLQDEWLLFYLTYNNNPEAFARASQGNFLRWADKAAEVHLSYDEAYPYFRQGITEPSVIEELLNNEIDPHLAGETF